MTGAVLNRRVLPVLLLFLGAAALRSQEHGQFQFMMELNYIAADRTIELVQGIAGNPRDIAELPGNRLASATTGLLAGRRLTVESLQRALESVKFNQDLGEDLYRLGETRANALPLKELLGELRRRNFGQRVASTVEQLFPAGAVVRGKLPVYFVAFGHENIDAFVRRVAWRGNEPLFVGDGEGEPTIVVNLSKAIRYGRTTEERFVRLLQTVAHEVFHAAFDAYKDTSPVWREFYSAHGTPLDALLDLTQNEGIAYYMSLVQAQRGRLPQDWQQRVGTSFAAFNRAAEELSNPAISPGRIEEILRSSNTSGYWESFASMAGMVMAKHIDQTLGRNALTESVARGPLDFFGKYLEVTRREGDAPRLTPQLVRMLQGAGVR